MYRRINPRPLTAHDIELIRRVALCWTNQQIADHFGVTNYTARNQLHNLHHQLGTDKGPTDGKPSSFMARVRLIAWAYKNGLMTGEDADALAATMPVPQPARPAAEPPVLPAPLVRAVLEVCEAIVADRPRGDLRKVAEEALRVAGRRRPSNQHRAKPAA